jgi:hypothetical protein
LRDKKPNECSFFSYPDSHNNIKTLFFLFEPSHPTTPQNSHKRKIKALKMGSTNPFNDNPLFIFKRIFHLTLYFLLSISLICLYFNLFYLTHSSTQFIPSTTIFTYHSSISSSPPSNSSIGMYIYMHAYIILATIYACKVNFN